MSARVRILALTLPIFAYIAGSYNTQLLQDQQWCKSLLLQCKCKAHLSDHSYVLVLGKHLINGTQKLQQRPKGLTSWGSNGSFLNEASNFGVHDWHDHEEPLHLITDTLIHIEELPHAHIFKTSSHQELQSQVSFVPIMMKLAPFAAASIQ